MQRHKVLSRWTLVAAICIGAGLAACSSDPNTTGPNGTVDMAGSPGPGRGDLAGVDLAGADLAGADLAGGGGPGADSACTTEAQNSCAKFQECSPNGFIISYLSMSQCTTRLKQLCLNNFGLPGSTRTAAEVQRCATAIVPLSCMDYYDGSSPTMAGCRSTGTLANGVACGAGDQCSSGYCNINYQTSCGVCAQYVKLGSACQTTTGSPACEPGSFCGGATGSQRCAAVSGLGGACSSTGPLCKFPLACRSGVCSQPRNLGDTCDPMVNLDCDFTKGAQCNSTSRKCEQVYSFRTAGMSCGIGTMTPYPQCTGSSLCTVVTGNGTCIAPAADDAACSTSSTPGCQAPAVCRSGFCRFPTPASCR